MNTEHKEIQLDTIQLHKKNKAVLFTVLSAVFLAIVLATSLTLAVLTDLFTDTSNPNIGEISAGLYTNGGSTLISGTYDETEGYLIGSPILVTMPSSVGGTTALDLYVKNTGTINALVRIQLSIYQPTATEEDPQALATTAQLALSNTGWINDFPSAGSWYLYSYYNSVLAPNTPVSIGATLEALNNTLLNENVELMIRVDMIAHSGNAYQLEDDGQTVADEDKPFGVLDSGFLSSWTAWQA